MTLLLLSWPDNTGEHDSLERVARQVQTLLGMRSAHIFVLTHLGKRGGTVEALLDPDREVSQIFAAWKKGLLLSCGPMPGTGGRLDQPRRRRIWPGCRRCAAWDVQAGSDRLNGRMGVNAGMTTFHISRSFLVASASPLERLQPLQTLATPPAR